MGRRSGRKSSKSGILSALTTPFKKDSKDEDCIPLLTDQERAAAREHDAQRPRRPITPDDLEPGHAFSQHQAARPREPQLPDAEEQVNQRLATAYVANLVRSGDRQLPEVEEWVRSYTSPAQQNRRSRSRLSTVAENPFSDSARVASEDGSLSTPPSLRGHGTDNAAGLGNPFAHPPTAHQGSGHQHRQPRAPTRRLTAREVAFGVVDDDEVPRAARPGNYDTRTQNSLRSPFGRR
ncbi:hypothetical protein ACRE_018740 [Hapsidospora chrysogenum ATCC 11550]|uniref:Uncharacterized protein n=1 Tax=Hapsidospora chrysogenum (strain ATCC 11550 / CBS 779.69 / DSM 880 / IAM 14645 / JCM 23072 / IMI 49137) TaxID=857340 RepID=A0A086TCZ6_HAPC1|nr:hypothetical protein ACRE_018740 [Hapsidospora chrysogenum ATCC 11550]